MLILILAKYYAIRYDNNNPLNLRVEYFEKELRLRRRARWIVYLKTLGEIKLFKNKDVRAVKGKLNEYNIDLEGAYLSDEGSSLKNKISYK